MTDDLDDTFSGRPLTRRAPRSSFPEHEQSPRDSYQLVHDELMLDGVSRMNLATFCTTWVEPEVRALMAESLDKNIVDKDEYPQTAALEERCVRMLAHLFHSPSPETTRGTSTTGSSEAAMLAGLAAKWRWKAKREAAGRTAPAVPNLISGPVQVCWEKFARYFDVQLRQAPMADGYTLTPEQVLERIDENTIGVVVTLGQTFTGLFEDVAAISAALDEHEERTGQSVDIHIDAASGGFVAPFCAPDLLWDFRLPRVKSINASGHKTGLAPIGVGWVIWRDADDLPDELVFDVNYLGGSMPTFGLNFSRPGGQVIASYYDFIRLGRDGYTKVQSETYAVAKHLAGEIRDLGRFEILHDGDASRGIPAVTWTMSGDQPFTVFDVAEELRTRGWLVPAYTLPADKQEVAVQRIVVRHGLSLDLADLLLDDMRRALKKLDDRPPSRSLTPAEGQGFDHSATARVAEAAR